jgi:hypothetical protein
VRNPKEDLFTAVSIVCLEGLALLAAPLALVSRLAPGAPDPTPTDHDYMPYLSNGAMPSRPTPPRRRPPRPRQQPLERRLRLAEMLVRLPHDAQERILDRWERDLDLLEEM